MQNNAARLPKAALLALILCISTCAGTCLYAGPHEKEVVGIVEPIPNYLFHVFVLGKTWDAEDEYSKTYSNLLSKGDKLYIHKKRDMIAWGNGRGGPFFVPLFFIPCALRIETKEALKKYLEDLYRGIDDDFHEFNQRYNDSLSSHAISELTADTKANKSFLKQISRILIDNFDVYMNEVWPIEKPKITAVADKLSARFRGKRIIEKWENKLRIQFPGNRFEITLTSANDEAPSANNLTPTLYNFYYEPDDFDGLFLFVNHEIATNLLGGAMYDLMKNETLAQKIRDSGHDDATIWRAFEALSEFYLGQMDGLKRSEWKGRLFGGGSYDFDLFFQIYDNEFRINPNRPAKDMMKRGVERYIGNKAQLEYDFLITHSKMQPPKGTILLIHGAAPLNVDGRIPMDSDSVYTKINMYRDLADELNGRGWDVARYGKYGVFRDHVDYEKYKDTDLALTLEQLNDVWSKLPRSSPIIVFAASEGTLHASHLPLSETSGVILLGAIATNIGDVFLERAVSREEKRGMAKRLREARSMKRDEMWGRSHPAGRIVDELDLKDNWTYYKIFSETPFLILHGESDKEVPLGQAYIWQKKLPRHDITLVTRPNGNHTFGTGDSFDAAYLAQTITDWLDRSVKDTAKNR